MNEKKRNIGDLPKTRLSEFNKAEAQGWIIDRFVRIEARIDRIIVDYFKPENKIIFVSVVLNSSVLTIGAKIKILANIGIKDSTLNKIRKLSAIRNGFSHTLIHNKGKITISLNKKPNENIKTEMDTVIEVMNSNGKITHKDAFEYLIEFFDLLKEIEKEI